MISFSSSVVHWGRSGALMDAHATQTFDDINSCIMTRSRSEYVWCFGIGKGLLVRVKLGALFGFRSASFCVPRLSCYTSTCSRKGLESLEASKWKQHNKS